MNLPREIRYKQENVILVGLIPGPKEPSHTINSYISPLVSELLELWNGVIIPVGEGQQEKVFCAIVGIGCDLPAGRKLCGFLSHSANLGCSRCFKEFSRGFGSSDYSGFDRSTWNIQTNMEHRQRVARIVKSANLTEQRRLESQLGCRYSSLLQLPYFDPIKMLTIDPMHNLFLGTAKYIMRKVWIENSYLDPNKLSVIEERLSQFCLPSGVTFGRLPGSMDPSTKQSSGKIGSFTFPFTASLIYFHPIILSAGDTSYSHAD